jgi:hypothetical protein
LLPRRHEAILMAKSKSFAPTGSFSGIRNSKGSELPGTAKNGNTSRRVLDIRWAMLVGESDTPTFQRVLPLDGTLLRANANRIGFFDWGNRPHPLSLLGVEQRGSKGLCLPARAFPGGFSRSEGGGAEEPSFGQPPSLPAFQSHGPSVRISPLVRHWAV